MAKNEKPIDPDTLLEILAQTLIRYEQGGGDIQVAQSADYGIVFILPGVVLCPNHPAHEARLARIGNVCSSCAKVAKAETPSQNGTGTGDGADTGNSGDTGTPPAG